MAESDALSNFKFPKGKGLFCTFEDGDEFRVRVLTTDPVVTTKEFEGADGEVAVSTKFAFVIYNWTLSKAQILNAGATITKAIQKLHQDEEWGANIKKMDIKITATGNQMKRRYEVTPMPHAEDLTPEQIRECQNIDLEERIPDGQRMSFYNPEETSGYDKARLQHDRIKEHTPGVADSGDYNNLGDEPVNYDDIPG